MDYNSVYVELEYTIIRKNSRQIITLEAKLVNSANTRLSELQSFLETLRKITLALRKIAKNDLSFHLHFGRCDIIEGKITHRRYADYDGWGSDLIENEGCYLTDSRGNRAADYWLDIDNDLFDSIMEFSDNVYYWDMDWREI